MNIPGKAYTAAHRAATRHIEKTGGSATDAIAVAVAAAAPFIAAQALRDEADRVDTLERTTAPERVRAHMRAVSLRLRADELDSQ